MSIFNTLDSGWYNENIVDLLKESREKYNSNILHKLIKAIIVPHAGLKYSGLCAAASYSSTLNSNLDPNHTIKRIVILGTWHSCSVEMDCDKLLLPSVESGTIPIRDGEIKLDIDKFDKVLENSQIIVDSENKHFMNEHSIEIQMSFIHYCYPEAKIIPILVGKRDNYKDVIDSLSELDNKNTLWILSGDFYHINGRFNFQMKNSEVKTYNAKAINLFLEPVEGTSQKMLKHYNSYTPTICGWHVFRLWVELPVAHTLHGNITCYYTSAYNEVNYEKLPADYESSVSYLSVIYYSKSLKLEKIFTNYDLLNIDIAIKELIELFESEEVPKYEMIDYYGENSPRFIKLFIKLIGFNTYNLNNYYRNNLLIEDELKKAIGIQSQIPENFLSTIVIGIGLGILYFM